LKGSKSIELLKTFNTEEMKLFEKFIASPFHNSVKKYGDLFEILRNFHPEYDSKLLTKEYIFKKLYGEKPFKQQTLWNLMSGFEKLIEDYFVQLQLKDSIEKEIFLTGQFLKRKLSRSYSKQSERMNSFFEKNKIGRDFFNYKAISENFLLDYNFMEDKQHLLTDNIKHKGEYLILKFMMDICDVANDMEVNYDMYNSEYRNTIPYIFVSELRLKELVEKAQQNNFEYSFVLEICYHWVMMILEPADDTHFENFRKVFDANEHRLSRFEKYYLNTAMIGYCTRMNRRGNKNYRNIIFEIDKYRLKEGIIFYHEGQIPKNIYKQIVINGVMLKEYNWVENFMETYTHKLKPEFQKPMYDLCSSFLHFELKNYELVLKSLSKIDNLDIRDKTLAKINIAKTYYELKDTEALLHHIDSSKHFLNNNESVNAERKVNYINFFNSLHNLVLLKENADNSAISVLKKRLVQDKYVPGKKWLLEKIGELESS
jgi:hypothetical protein